MAKQRGNFFGMMTAALVSMIRWHGKTKTGDRNQGYGSPIYTPRRKKLKGWQKKSQLSSFNKNR